MQDSDEFERYAKFIQDSRWSWFLTLKFPRVDSQEHPLLRVGNAKDAFMVWHGEADCLYIRGPEKSAVQYIRVIEKRATGDILFHVLLNGIPEKMHGYWRYRWWQLTTGGAWDRRLDDRMENLIRYFFYKRSFDVEFRIWWEPTYCEAVKVGH